MVYTVYNMGYNFGEADANSKHRLEKFQLQSEQIDIANQLRIEKERRTKDVTNLTTQYHESKSAIKAEADSIIANLTSGGLRNDLTRSDRVQCTDSTTGDTHTGGHGLHERDVRDIIDLTRRADETREKLTACQGIIRTWMNSRK